MSELDLLVWAEALREKYGIAWPVDVSPEDLEETE